MSDAQPTEPLTVPASAPAVTWRRRALRRTAGSLGAAVVLAAVGPALANAAGADVANPVAIALRASGEGIKDALTGDEAETTATPCVTPTDPVEPSVEPSAEPSVDPVDPSVDPVEPSVDPVETSTDDPDTSVSSDPTEKPVVEPTADPTEVVAEPTADPTDVVAEPTAEPTADPSGEPGGEPVGEPTDDCEEAEATPTAVPVEEPSETPDEDAEDSHGKVVSTVAQCAPKGKDPLLDVDGAPGNHGGYVKVAAHGESLTLPWGTYDLSTQAGADALCASLDAARDALPEEPAKAEKKKDGKKAKAERGGKPAKAKPAKAAKDRGGKGKR